MFLHSDSAIPSPRWWCVLALWGALGFVTAHPASPARAYSLRPTPLKNPFITPLPLTHVHHRMVGDPGLTLLDEAGLLAHAVPAPEIRSWVIGLQQSHRSGHQAGLLHLHVGEYDLASNEEPELAIQHFVQSQRLLHHSDPIAGRAAYDIAIAHFAEGAFRQATDDFYHLLVHPLKGYDRRECALWYRHALACYQEHAAHARLGIPEPDRLDPYCGAASLAAALRHLGLPYSRTSLAAACRVTGVGSSMQDLVNAARRFDAAVRVVSANDSGLVALPKPMIAYVEHDHFVAVISANRKGVAYLCSDCGPWPGGRVNLTWEQWHALNPGVYGVVTRSGSPTERRLLAQLSHRVPWTSPVQLASRLPLSGLGFRQLAPIITILRGQLVLSCGHKPPTQHCASITCCPMDSGGSPAGGTGPGAGDPVNLATLEEEYQPESDIQVYNPHGPNISWKRVYNSLRLPDTTYEDDDFGVGWSQTYNSLVYDPSAATLPQVFQGGNNTFSSSGLDQAATGLTWDIVLNGSTIASSANPNGWSVTLGSYQFTIGVPAGATTAPNYEVRSATRLYYGYSAYFGVVPPNSAPQGVTSPSMNATGTDTPANGATWDVVYHNAVIASSSQPNGWSATMPTQTTFTVTPPIIAAADSGYEVRYQFYYYVYSAFFSVTPNAYMPSSGANATKYIIEPNGGRISFTAPAIPSAAQPKVSCTVQAGAPMLVEWDYDTGTLTGHYLITYKDRSSWATTPVSKVIGGGALCYSVGQLADRNGNAVDCYYSSVATAAGFPVLTAMTDASTGSILLSVQHATDGTGNVLSVTDAYGRSIYYHEGTYSGDQEVDTVSQVVPTGTAAPAFRWEYGYQNFYLSTITVPSPAGTGNSTATINYNATTNAVSSIVDGNGNTRSYATAMLGGVTVTVTDAQSNLTYSYTGNYDSNMSQTSKTDGIGRVIQSIAYSDPSDPYRPSSVLSGDAFYTMPPGSTRTYNHTGTDAPTHPTWDIVQNGVTVDYYGGNGGWSVSDMYGQFQITAPATATPATGYEVRYNYGTNTNHSLMFDVGTTKAAATSSWDRYGNLLSTTSPRGTTSTNTYSYANFPLGELTQMQTGSKSPTTFTYYEPSGLTHTVTSPLPGTVSSNQTVTTSYNYSSLGNMLSITRPGNNAAGTLTTTFNYTADGTYQQAEALGQPITTTDNLGKVSHFRYDARGNQVTATDPSGNEFDAAYNLADQKVQVTYPPKLAGGARTFSASTYLYPGGPLIAVTTDDEGGTAVRQISYSYGEEGERLLTTGETEPASCTYDACYRVVTRSDGNGSVTSYQYNAAGYLGSVSYPNTNGTFDTTQYSSYDADGHVLTRVDGRGVVTDFLYADPADLLTDRQYPATSAMNVHFSYDAYGRRSTMTDSTGSSAYAYDDLDDPTLVTTTFTGLAPQSIGYSYYPDGTRNSMATPAGTFTYGDDGDGRMNSLANAFGETTSWSYQDNGWLATQADPAATSSFTYNGRGEIVEIAHRQPGGTLLSDLGTIQYDAAANCTSVTSSIPGAPSNYSGQTTYAFDTRDQLTQEQGVRSGGYTISFAYDAAGNPATLRGVPNNTYNPDNQLADTGFGYDGNGNPTTYRGNTLSFNAENHLVAFGGVLQAGYNGDGLRAWKQNGSGMTYYLYDRQLPVCELGADGSVTSVNTFGADGLVSRHTSAGSVFYTFDERGNVVQRLSSSGAVLATYTFDAFGNRQGTDTSTDPFCGFGGQRGYYTDAETGLALLTFRYYDPSTARFLNRDPMEYRGGVNVYEYVGNNPSVRVDPSGLGWLPGNPITYWLGTAAACGAVALVTVGIYQGDDQTCDPEKRCNDVMSCIGAIVGAAIATITAESGPVGACLGSALGSAVTSIGQAACHHFCSSDAGDWKCYVLNGVLGAATGCAGAFIPDPAPTEGGEQAGSIIQSYLVGPLSNALGSAWGNACAAASHA